MIIDLDSPKKGRSEDIQIITRKVRTSDIGHPTSDIIEVPPLPVPDASRQSKQLRNIELEDSRVRGERAKIHLKYRALLDADLKPKRGATPAHFIQIYEEIQEKTEELKNIHIRRQQIELYGEERKQPALDNATLAKIDALKHKRRRVNDNLYKARKALSIAEASGKVKNANNVSAKISQLELEQLEISHELKKLENV